MEEILGNQHGEVCYKQNYFDGCLEIIGQKILRQIIIRSHDY